MNFRTTYILFGAVTIVVVVFLLFLAFGPSGDADEYVLSSLREAIGKDSDKQKEVVGSIKRLEIARLAPSGEPLVFTRAGDEWKLEAPYGARVDSRLIDDFLTRLIQARVDRKADISHKLNDFGLDSPAVVVTLRRDEKGKSEDHWIKLGNMTSGSAGVVFALTKDHGAKEPIAIRKTDLEGLFGAAKDPATAGDALKTITEFRPRGLLAGGNPMAGDVVNRIRLKADAKEIVLQKDASGTWRFVTPEEFGPADPEGDTAPLGPAAENIAGVKPLLTVLTGLRIDDPAAVVENPAKFDDFGLDPGKETMLIELGLKTGQMDVLRVGKKDGDKVAARLGNDSFVVKLPDKALEPVRKLLARPQVMRDRNLLQFSAASIDAIDVKVQGDKKFELRHCGTPKIWRLFEEGTGDAHELVNTLAVQTLLNQLTDRRTIVDFPDTKAGDAAYGLDAPAVEIALWQNGVLPDKTEEKKEDKDDGDKKDEAAPKKVVPPPPVKRPSLQGEPTVKLKFSKAKAGVVYVRRQVGTFSTLLALPESLFTVANRGLVEYLDLNVPSFDRAKVVKISLQRGADQIEIEKDKGDPASISWKFLKPADAAGRGALADRVNRAVAALGTLHPAKIVAAHAAADPKWFDPKTTFAFTITVKDGKAPVTYTFGNETEDKKAYYAKFGGKDHVYRVGKDAVDGLLDGDLADPTVFRLDAARVKSIKFTGWNDARGILTLEFVRKNDKEWAVKDKADFAVNNDPFNQFVGELEVVRADRFAKGGPLPEYRLDPKDGALIMEITLEGEKDAITVTVGAPDKDGKTYFATSNRLPGAVLMLFTKRFEELRKNPAYFKKM